MSGRLGDSRKYLVDKARAEGADLRFAEPNELFIDIDASSFLSGLKKLAALRQRLWAVQRYHTRIVKVKRRLSRGGNGWHVTVTLAENISPEDRCLLHACCGSDPVRELLRLRAIKFSTSDQTPAFLDNPNHPDEDWPLEDAIKESRGVKLD